MNADEYADSILQVMDNIGVDDFHFLGQHGGAAIGINLGIRHPERIGKLILSGAGREENLTEEQIQELIDRPMTRDLQLMQMVSFLIKHGMYIDI
ncbi:MAG: hypothetical protein Ct9H90mP13_11240 [Pseudomonadota bacterium]|nr:MAG: hypothetical protein Ct9H90mP13_11240 [Pseudomonadota bacterium]